MKTELIAVVGRIIKLLKVFLIPHAPMQMLMNVKRDFILVLKPVSILLALMHASAEKGLG